MSALKDSKGSLATSFEDKADMVRRGAFPFLPVGTIGSPQHWEGKAHQRIDKARVGRALFDQSQKKAPRLETHNFSTLRLLWEWEASCVTALI